MTKYAGFDIDKSPEEDLEQAMREADIKDDRTGSVGKEEPASTKGKIK